MTPSFQRRAEFIWRPRGLDRVTFSTAAPRLPEEGESFCLLSAVSWKLPIRFKRRA